MAQELSSNWKKLQAKIKAESSSASTAAAAAAATAPGSSSAKRKAAEPAEAAPAARGGEQKKKRKLREPSRKPTAPPADQPAAGRKKARSAPGAPEPAPMGVTQSSAVARGSAATVAPSLALWAEDNDISAEQLAEAYGLGLRGRDGPVVARAEAERVNEGRAPGVDVGKYVALDCEMVGVGPDGRDSALARASLVDFHGRQVYDALVRPRQRVTDWRAAVTGLGPRHLAAARDFDAVRADVAALLRGRVLVGHDLRHDLAALDLAHPATHVRDTARLAGFRQYGHGPKPALRVLARELLDMDIQSGHHSSIEDARVAMLLFRKRKSEFDMEHANKYEKAATASKAGSQQPKNNKKKKKKKH